MNALQIIPVNSDASDYGIYSFIEASSVPTIGFGNAFARILTLGDVLTDQDSAHSDAVWSYTQLVESQILEEVDDQAELKWISEHKSELSKYRGQWIAVSKESVVGNGNDIQTAMRLSDERGISDPLIIFVPEDDFERTIAF